MARSNKPLICFIDDDPAELSRFTAAFHTDYEVVAAGTYKEALDRLKLLHRRRPDLWVLDLYFPDLGRTNTPEELRGMMTRAAAFDASRREFMEYLQSIGQGSTGGLALLARCREGHGAPVVMFTRKGTIDDAIASLQAGAVEVLRKPMPSGLPADQTARVEALDSALMDARSALSDRFAYHIARSTHWARYRSRYMAVATFVLGLFLDRALGLVGL